MAAAAAGGGGLVRRPDQVVSPPPAVLAPGGAAGVFRGRLVIVYGTGPGSGVFVYDPAPGAGNLIASITGTAGTDPYGNAYPAGISEQTGTGQGVQMYDGGLLFSGLSFTDAVDLRAVMTAEAGSSSKLVIASGLDSSSDVAAEIVLASKAQSGTGSPLAQLLGTALVATEPGTTGTAETWHPLSLDAGWSAVSGFPTPGYRLNAVGNVEFTGRITHASLASSGSIAGLPAGYYSTYQRGCPVSLVAGSPAASGLPRLYCSTAGALNVESLSATAGTVTLDLDGSTLHLSSG